MTCSKELVTLDRISIFLELLFLGGYFIILWWPRECSNQLPDTFYFPPKGLALCCHVCLVYVRLCIVSWQRSFIEL